MTLKTIITRLRSRSTRAVRELRRDIRAGRMSRLTAVRQCSWMYELTTEERDFVRGRLRG